MTSRLVVAALLALLPLGAQEQQSPLSAPKPLDAGEETINAEDLTAHLEYLSSDEMKGRDAGSEEARRAAAYIAAHMEKHGLKPAGKDKEWEHGFAALGRVCRNVCGLLPGTDARLRKEYLVIGAHYDHVGLGMSGSRTPGRRGEIHNGADDNASGTSALLELIEAFSKKPTKRSILFLAFDAEEKGLLGSKAWTKKPTRSLGRIAAMINLDMVGRSKDGYLFIGGVNTGRGFEKMIRAANEPFGFNLELHGGGNAPSDNASFYRKKIPVLFFFTAEHGQYHTPDDDLPLLNTADQALITRLAYRVGRKIGDGKRPRFQKDDRNAMPASSQRGRDYVRRMLGVDLGSFDEDAGGLPVTRVHEGGLAAKARIKEADVLLSLDGYKAQSREAIQSVLALKSRGDSIDLRIKRKGRTLKTKLSVR